ncbi:MarR family transcriptional regulator, partial [Rhizobium leguminosarum]|nr:MarR family transcriptional regulator [Rhizobium leguminosarum]
GEIDTIMTAIGQAAGCTLKEMAEMRDMLHRLRGNLGRPGTGDG